MRYDASRPLPARAPVKPRHPAPLNALRAFETAARCLSFNAAAQQLFVTPAAVSHQVKHLENYLGVKLFHRGNRTVELTSEGRALAATLSELFAQLDLALDRATAQSSADLRVSTLESFAAKWLAPRVHRFHRQHPELRLRIETGNELADLQRGNVDVAIRYGAGGYSGMLAERWMDAPVFPVCAPVLLTSASPPLAAPADLQNHTLLHDESSQGRAGVPGWSAWLQAAGADHVDASRGPMFASIYLAQEAALAGHGIALGLAPLVEQDLQSGRLVQPFDRVLDNAYAFWLLRRDAPQRNPAAEAFCQWLHDEAKA